MRIFKSLLKNSEETDSSILPPKANIVLVEPDDQDAIRVIEILNQAGFDVTHVKSCTQTFECLQSSNDQVVAIITDFTLAVGNAIDIAHYARSISPDIIIIAVGHDIDETLLIKAMQAGVSYCITKVADFATQLPNLIKLSKEQQQGFKTTIVTEIPAKTPAKNSANSADQPIV
jgi:DNA-binding NtrC family response regulator